MKDKKKLIIVSVILVVFLVFAVALAKRMIRTSRQKEEIASLKQTVSQIEEENSNLKETLSDTEDESYMEKIARDNGYVYPEERIYYDSDAKEGN